MTVKYLNTVRNEVETIENVVFIQFINGGTSYQLTLMASTITSVSETYPIISIS